MHPTLYTVTYTLEEIQALAGLIDAGLRATGLRNARIAANLADKLQSAIDKDKAIISDVQPINKEDKAS